MSAVISKIVFFILGFIAATALYASVPALFMPDGVDQDGSLPVSHETVDDGEITVKSIPIVAVSQYQDSGILGNLTVKLIPGDSHVLIETNPFLEPDVQYSANLAVSVAKEKTGQPDISKDFVLTYDIESQVVGGGSAGAATALAVMAAIEGKDIRDDALITGSINPDGSIGQIGGVLEKAKTAAEEGYTLLLVPSGQSKVTYYERVAQEEDTPFGFTIRKMKYVPRTVDLKETAQEEWGIEIREVSGIDEAAEAMLI